MSNSDRGDQLKLVGLAFLALFWLAVAALYFTMFYDMGASYERAGFDSEQNRVAYAESTTSKVAAECGDLTGSIQLRCVEEAVKASAEYQQGERDLEAQRGMSDWAFWVSVIAGFQLLVTVVGLIYIKGTLDATRDAVGETGKATDAMNLQNELAEQRMRAWLRADIRVVSLKFKDQRMLPITVVSTVNVGGFPATNTVASATLVICHDHSAPDLGAVGDGMKPHWDWPTPPIGETIFPQQPAKILQLDIGFETPKKTKIDTELWLYLIIRIDYQSRDTRCSTIYYFSLSPPDKPSNHNGAFVFEDWGTEQEPVLTTVKGAKLT